VSITIRQATRARRSRESRPRFGCRAPARLRSGGGSHTARLIRTADLDNETRHNTYRLLADAFEGDFTVPSPVGAD
jgi:hypothetical protein